ncbi:MAG: Nif3-like dinuclear metal center hexameric protein [bacterium]
MRANEVRELFRKSQTWVNWDKTWDQFIYGSPDTEVKGIACAWNPTNAALKEAAAKGLNLFITHEPTFYDGFQGNPSAERMIIEKKKLLDELGLTVLRCHDVWDRIPGGICDSWADWFGHPVEPRPVEEVYKICLVGDQNFGELAKFVAEKVKPLGQNTVLTLGDFNKRVSRMAVGTGAGSWLPHMYELKPDVCIVTDDGYNSWDGGLWAVDLDFPVIMVNHCTSEKPGMMAMPGWLKERFPSIPIEYVDVHIALQAL